MTTVNYDPGNCVYVISNVGFKGMYKVGKTKDLKPRLSTYNTGAPINYKVEHIEYVSNMKEIEDLVKEQLSEYRVGNKEWFKVELSVVIDAVKHIAEMWKFCFNAKRLLLQLTVDVLCDTMEERTEEFLEIMKPRERAVGFSEADCERVMDRFSQIDHSIVFN